MSTRDEAREQQIDSTLALLTADEHEDVFDSIDMAYMRDQLREAREALAALGREKSDDAWHRGWHIAVRERDEARHQVGVLSHQLDAVTRERDELRKALCDIVGAICERTDQFGNRMYCVADGEQHYRNALAVLLPKASR